MEIILNGNTLESSVDQYISMVMEKTIAGPNKDNPNFYNVLPSSEMQAYTAFPGIKPTFTIGNIEYGTIYLQQAKKDSPLPKKTKASATKKTKAESKKTTKSNATSKKSTGKASSAKRKPRKVAEPA